MGTEGLEPSRTITRQRILSPSCLPISPHSLIIKTTIILSVDLIVVNPKNHKKIYKIFYKYYIILYC